MKIFGLIAFFVLPVSLYAQHAPELESFRFSPEEKTGRETAFALSIGPDSGFLFGMLQEWVFIDRDGGNAYDDVLSRLDWQQNPQFYLGVSGSLMPLPRFFIGFGGWMGIPGILGYLEDRDWDAVTGVYDHFSHHDNLLKNSLFFDLNVGYCFIRSSYVLLNGLLGFNYKQIHMTGENGWREYPPGSPAIPMYGEVIDYELNFFIPYLGVELNYAPAQILSVDVFLSVSPWITFVYDRDDHILAGEYFQDLPQWGFHLSGVISLSFHLGGGWNLCLKNTIMWSPPIKGPSFVGGSLSAGELAGASLLLGGVSLSLKWSFSIYGESRVNRDKLLILPR